MCLGEYATVDEVLPDGKALVRFGDGSVRTASLAVPTVEGIDVRPGHRVMVSIGMVLTVEDRADGEDALR